MPFCNKCGNEYNFGQEACEQCGIVLPNVKEELSSDSDKSDALENPRLKRLVAGFIDVLFAHLLILPFFLSKKIMILVFARKLIIFVPGLYLLFKDSFGGKSLGKSLSSILVYSESKKKTGNISDSFLRNWPLFMPIVGTVIMAGILGVQIFIGEKKRIGDKYANTIILTDLDYQRKR